MCFTAKTELSAAMLTALPPSVAVLLDAFVEVSVLQHQHFLELKDPKA